MRRLPFRTFRDRSILRLNGLLFGLLSCLLFGGMSHAMAQSPSPPDTSECRLQEPVSLPDSLSLYTSNTPRIGSSDAPVRILEFFDPNCPHCRTLHNRALPQLREMIPADSTALYMRPYPLSRKSAPQIFALYHAHEKGRFSQLLDVMFSFGSPSSMTPKTLRYYARAAGLPADTLFRAVASGRYGDRLRRSMSVAKALGVDGTPTLFIEGRPIPRSSYRPKCLSTLIRKQLQTSSL